MLQCFDFLIFSWCFTVNVDAPILMISKFSSRRTWFSVNSYIWFIPWLPCSSLDSVSSFASLQKRTPPGEQSPFSLYTYWCCCFCFCYWLGRLAWYQPISILVLDTSSRSSGNQSRLWFVNLTQWLMFLTSVKGLGDGSFDYRVNNCMVTVYFLWVFYIQPVC